jgi:hypothetical protein
MRAEVLDFFPAISDFLDPLPKNSDLGHAALRMMERNMGADVVDAEGCLG